MCGYKTCSFNILELSCLTCHKNVVKRHTHIFVTHSLILKDFLANSSLNIQINRSSISSNKEVKNNFQTNALMHRKMNRDIHHVMLNKNLIEA